MTPEPSDAQCGRRRTSSDGPAAPKEPDKRGSPWLLTSRPAGHYLLWLQRDFNPSERQATAGQPRG